jgi:hypothetical protein
METERPRHGIQRLIIAVPFGLPVPVPDPLPGEGCSGNTRSLAIWPFLIPELPAIDIREGGMSQVEVFHGPNRRVIGAPILALAEENQLETEPFTSRVHHITGVIPPLSAKVLMLEVIPGKLVVVARDGFAPDWSVSQKAGGDQDRGEG